LVLQTTVLIYDQAEELLAKHRVDFLQHLKPFVFLQRDSPDAICVILVVNTENGKKSLLSLNGGCLFSSVEVPLCVAEAVRGALGANQIQEVFGDQFDAFWEKYCNFRIVHTVLSKRVPESRLDAFAKELLGCYEDVYKLETPVSQAELKAASQALSS